MIIISIIILVAFLAICLLQANESGNLSLMIPASLDLFLLIKVIEMAL